MPNRLVIFLDELYEKNGRTMYGQFNWLIYAAEIANHFTETTIFLPIKPRAVHKTSAGRSPKILDLDDTNFHVVELPPYHSIASSIPRLPWVARQLYLQRHAIRKAHAVLLRVPSLCALLLAEWARLLGVTNVCFYVAGNIETQADPVVKGGCQSRVWGLLARLINRLTCLCARNALVISVSPEMGKKFQLARTLIPKPRKVMIFPIPMHRQSDLYRRPPNRKNSKLRLIRVCRLYPSKDLETLLASVKLLIERGLSLELEIVGTGDSAYYGQLIHLIEQLHIGPYVKFTGLLPHEDTMMAYRRADVQVISSLAEGFPRVIWEGWASSLPLVATTVGGIPAIVQHEQNGLLVPPGDPAALADAITRLHREPELRQTLIANGLAQARDYTRENQAAVIAKAMINP